MSIEYLRRIPASVWFNVVAFEIGWLACVAGGNWAALLFALVYFPWHFSQFANAGEWRGWLVVAAAGIGMDQMLALSGVFDFGSTLLPLWLWVLWCLYATTLFHSLRWLTRRPLVAACVGAVAGPFSYYAGSLLGAAHFGYELSLVMVILAVLWFVFMYVASCLVNWVSRDDPELLPVGV